MDAPNRKRSLASADPRTPPNPPKRSKVKIDLTSGGSDEEASSALISPSPNTTPPAPLGASRRGRAKLTMSTEEDELAGPDPCSSGYSAADLYTFQEPRTNSVRNPVRRLAQLPANSAEPVVKQRRHRGIRYTASDREKRALRAVSEMIHARLRKEAEKSRCPLDSYNQEILDIDIDISIRHGSINDCVHIQPRYFLGSEINRYWGEADLSPNEDEDEEHDDDLVVNDS